MPHLWERERLDADETLHPQFVLRLRRAELACGLTGVAAMLVHHGHPDLPEIVQAALTTVIYLGLAAIVVSQLLRYIWSRTRISFARTNAIDLGLSVLWLLGLGVLPSLPELPFSAGEVALGWSEVVTLLRGLLEVYEVIRRAASAGLNPALVLVLSFAVLIGLGTLLLMSPRCRPPGEPPAPWLTALFTSTSACCVTGLIVVDTATYWSRTGQLVILGLFQLGGLGIMTFGAFFALVLGRKLPMREHATFRDLLESQRLSDVGGLVRAIVGFTLLMELLGAAALTTLWPEKPWPERAFFATFHAISAFCNAGFSLHTEGFLGRELHWQVWGVVAGLIIVGGFGFGPLNNLRHVVLSRLRSAADGEPRPRILLSTRLVALTTAGLLVGGLVVFAFLEWNNPAHPLAWQHQLANAWFHSVTVRTAGFNTIDHEQLRPASKLVGVMLMFVGASPGSTGGGVKTTCMALTILTLRAVLRGRSTVEAYGRTIPQEQVFRGLAVAAIALTTLTVSCLCLVVIEDRPERFLDLLYEAASALGTVGLSANITPTLSDASRLVVIATMFLGRIGPLTLIVALAGSQRTASFEYPEERIALG